MLVLLVIGARLQQFQTLDNLLQSSKITFLQYLDRVPSGVIPQRLELIEEIKMEDVKQTFIYEQMARFVEQLPPEIAQEIMSMQPEEQEQYIMEMMMAEPGGNEQSPMQMPQQEEPQPMQSSQRPQQTEKDALMGLVDMI